MALNNLAWLYFERGDNRAVDYARRAFEGASKRAEIMDTFAGFSFVAAKGTKALPCSKKPRAQYLL